jgi:hypothetical protein
MVHTNIMFLGIIHPPVFCLKHRPVFLTGQLPSSVFLNIVLFWSKTPSCFCLKRRLF